MDSERYNTSAKVDVAEVDIDGRKITNLERRYVYLTPGGKEFIFALKNREWKIYTKNVLADLSPEGFGTFRDS
jgi:DNA-binding MarR family transcriptional regulator